MLGLRVDSMNGLFEFGLVYILMLMRRRDDFFLLHLTRIVGPYALDMYFRLM